MRNRAPWCKVLFQPQAKYGDEVCLKTEGLQYLGLENTKSSRRNAGLLHGTPKDMETISRMFEVPLRETFRDFGPSNNYSKEIGDLFNAKSDRVVKCLSGLTIRVSVRRFGASVRHISVSCEIFLNSI